jgi:Tfp pilus assembly protein PilV
MSRARCAERCRQRGDALLEALIAMVLLAVVAVGPAYVASRMAVTHKQINVSSNAVAQLRDLLLSEGDALCGTAQSISIGGQTLPVTVTCTNRGAVEIEGLALAAADVPRAIALSVDSADLFGGEGLIVVGE